MVQFDRLAVEPALEYFLAEGALDHLSIARKPLPTFTAKPIALLNRHVQCLGCGFQAIGMLVGQVGQILDDLVKTVLRLLLAQFLGHSFADFLEGLDLGRCNAIQPDEMKTCRHPYHVANVTQLLQREQRVLKRGICKHSLVDRTQFGAFQLTR